MIVICDGLADYYGELYSSDVFCTDEMVDRIVAITATVGEHWMRMRALSRGRSILAWKVTPKVHRFQHTGLYCQVLNPRHAQVYAEESLVGTMVKVWRMSVSGRYQAHAQRIVLVKRVLSVLLRYEGLWILLILIAVSPPWRRPARNTRKQKKKKENISETVALSNETRQEPTQNPKTGAMNIYSSDRPAPWRAATGKAD